MVIVYYDNKTLNATTFRDGTMRWGGDHCLFIQLIPEFKVIQSLYTVVKCDSS